MAAYYDMKGKSCTKDHYIEQVELLKKNWDAIEPDKRHSAPTVIREFRNEKLNVQMIWRGEVLDNIVESYFPSDYQLFRIHIYNFMNGKWVLEPSESTYYNRSKANTAFEDILLNYGKCYYDEEGDFILEDNLVQSHMPEDFKVMEEKIAKEKSTPKTVLEDGMVW